MSRSLLVSNKDVDTEGKKKRIQSDERKQMIKEQEDKAEQLKKKCERAFVMVAKYQNAGNVGGVNKSNNEVQRVKKERRDLLGTLAALKVSWWCLRQVNG